MKKPSQKRIKQYLQDIEGNFAELINSVIWYENNHMEDGATDIVGEIETLPSHTECHLLLNDLTNRKAVDFQVYNYKRLWWALINEGVVDKQIIDFCKNSPYGKILSDNLNTWYNKLDNGVDTKINIGKIIDNKLKP